MAALAKCRSSPPMLILSIFIRHRAAILRLLEDTPATAAQACATSLWFQFGSTQGDGSMDQVGTTSGRRFGRKLLLSGVAALMATLMVVGSVAAHSNSIKFDMVRSAVALNANCLPNAQAKVKITSIGPVEIMDVDASGLPPKTEFDFF